MGEVYRARDTKLGREVAIKVLPEALAFDPDRIARFEREAKVLASLNHPHIAALHGMEQSGDRHFLIMEPVEGETLAERLARSKDRALPDIGSAGVSTPAIAVEDALAIAQQIADALEAAHEKGIVHRDLKPANVKITPGERVKVLDFGLAKAMDPVGAGLQAGPSDVSQSILASALAREPDLTALPPNLNPRLAELLRRCLEKNPKRRWQAVGDLRAEIEAIASVPRSGPLTTQAMVPIRRWRSRNVRRHRRQISDPSG
jgi:serine/threonine protein kinase